MHAEAMNPGSDEPRLPEAPRTTVGAGCTRAFMFLLDSGLLSALIGKYLRLKRRPMCRGIRRLDRAA
jgi:hypothetical protein